MQLSNINTIPFNPTFASVVNASNTINFGFTGCIPSGSGAYYEIDNPGLSSIGFHITPPNNNWVAYQGSFDGVNFAQITFRQVGNDGYSREATSPEDYVGSVVNLRKIRFINSTGAATSGTVMGTLAKEVATLEGIEHSAPPHKFGNALFHKGFYLNNSSVTDSGLFFPSERRKFVVTYISMGASSVGANITIHDGSGTADNTDNWIFSTYVKAATNDTQQINAGLTTPYVGRYSNSGLFLTVDAAATIRGIIHGYETED